MTMDTIFKAAKFAFKSFILHIMLALHVVTAVNYYCEAQNRSLVYQPLFEKRIVDTRERQKSRLWKTVNTRRGYGMLFCSKEKANFVRTLTRKHQH